MPPLERLLAHSSPEVHELIADRLWEAATDADAVHTLETLAEDVDHGRIELGGGSAGGGSAADDAELANIPGSDGGSSAGSKRARGRRNRAPPPQRTEAEIAALRAERAAKRERTGAPPHVNGRARAGQE